MTNKSKWWEFHKENPKVYELFDKFTREAIASGRQHYSAYAIFEVMRWHTSVVTKSEEDFKLNNNHRPYYARYFMYRNPQYKDFFQLRELISER
jgi:hypothetical protein